MKKKNSNGGHRGQTPTLDFLKLYYPYCMLCPSAGADFLGEEAKTFDSAILLLMKICLPPPQKKKSAPDGKILNMPLGKYNIDISIIEY